MPHNTLINGTNYEIGGASILTGSTSYNLSNGKTLIGGTSYDVPFGSPDELILYDISKSTQILKGNVTSNTASMTSNGIMFNWEMECTGYTTQVVPLPTGGTTTVNVPVVTINHDIITFTNLDLSEYQYLNATIVLQNQKNTWLCFYGYLQNGSYLEAIQESLGSNQATGTVQNLKESMTVVNGDDFRDLYSMSIFPDCGSNVTTPGRSVSSTILLKKLWFSKE